MNIFKRIAKAMDHHKSLEDALRDVKDVEFDGNVIMTLPTSSAGLPTGALWNNSGVVNVVV